MAPPVEARRINIIQALLVHRSRLTDRTPSCDVSAFPRSRVMRARAVTSMAVHSTQPGELPSSDILTLRARWDRMSPFVIGAVSLKQFYANSRRRHMDS